jgi:hypothetical protein
MNLSNSGPPSRGHRGIDLRPTAGQSALLFRYLADGELQLHFELGFGYYPGGAQPDLLRQALKVIGEHFGLSLPRAVIESGRLPAVVTRTEES